MRSLSQSSGCRKARSPSKSSGSGCRKARSPSKSSGSGSHSAPLTEFGLPKGIVFTRGQNLLLQSKSFHTEPFTGSGFGLKVTGLMLLLARRPSKNIVFVFTRACEGPRMGAFALRFLPRVKTMPFGAGRRARSNISPVTSSPTPVQKQGFCKVLARRPAQKFR